MMGEHWCQAPPSPHCPLRGLPALSCAHLAGPLPFPYPCGWAGRQLGFCLSYPLHEVKQYKHMLSQGWDRVSSPGMLQLPDYQRLLFQISVDTKWVKNITAQYKSQFK